MACRSTRRGSFSRSLRCLFLAAEQKTGAETRKLVQASPFFDKLVFSKVKARLGGRVRIVLSGAAPLAQHVEDFLRVTMCSYVGQGYGLTETCAATFLSSGEAVRASASIRWQDLAAAADLQPPLTRAAPPARRTRRARLASRRRRRSSGSFPSRR